MKNKKRISFIPYSSIFTGNPKRISFNMLDDFDFSNIKNILTIKLINPPFKMLQIMLGRFKENAVIFKSSVMTGILKIMVNFKDNRIRIKNFTSASLDILFKEQGNRMIFVSKVEALLELFLKLEIKFKINTKATEKLLLFLKMKSSVLLQNQASLNQQLFLNFKENKVCFIKPKELPISVYMSAVVRENKLNLTAKGKSQLLAGLHFEENNIKLKSTVSAYVYKPILLGGLYSYKIEDWYSKTIEDTFYGFEIL